MHAGEGLWNLCAVLAALERRANGNPEVLRLTGLGHESLRVVAEHLQVPLPDAASLEARVAALLPRPPETSAVAPRPKPGGVANGEARAALGICDDILAKLDDLPGDADEFKESVGSKVASMRDWIESNDKVTDKMKTALENMQGGVNKWMRRGADEEEYDEDR
jgi:hypothetical protein